MNHLISSLCIGKYAPLAKYFKGLTIQDLTRLNDPEITDSFPYDIRLTLAVFFKDTDIDKSLLWSGTPGIIFPADEDDEFDYSNIKNECFPSYENLSKIEDPDILNLCNQIPLTVNIKNINELLNKIGKKSYTYIDFSWNKLYDNDLTYIVNAIKESNIDINAISLACNRISGYRKESRQKTDENLHYLLEKCEYVDITMTPVATIERLDFFKSLENDSPSFLLKLIWIPETALESQIWSGMIYKELHNEVRDVHRQYYRWIKTLPLDNENKHI
jgi:hypothetical protein